MAKGPLKVLKWSILRVRTKDDKLEYRVFGEAEGMVCLSDPLAEIDKGAGEGVTIKDRDVILVDKTVAYKDSEYFGIMQDHAESQGYKALTDMTDMITTRTFLPPEDYQTKAAKEEEAAREAARAEKRAEEDEQAKKKVNKDTKKAA